MGEWGTRAGYGHRVLVVIDDRTRRIRTAGTLLRAGFQSRGCASEADALDALDTFEPHLLLADVDLGGRRSGLELASLLTRRAPHLVVLLLSEHESALELPPGLVRRTRTMHVRDLDSSQALVHAVRSLAATGAAALAVPPATATRPRAQYHHALTA